MRGVWGLDGPRHPAPSRVRVTNGALTSGVRFPLQQAVPHFGKTPEGGFPLRREGLAAQTGLWD